MESTEKLNGSKMRIIRQDSESRDQFVRQHIRRIGSHKYVRKMKGNNSLAI